MLRHLCVLAIVFSATVRISGSSEPAVQIDQEVAVVRHPELPPEAAGAAAQNDVERFLSLVEIEGIKVAFEGDKATPIEDPPPSGPVSAAEPSVLSERSGGSISNDQFVALAMCESGTVDDGISTGGWRTGLYGIEDGAAGQMPPLEQRAYVQRIYDQYSASAWGVGCRGILGG